MKNILIILGIIAVVLISLVSAKTYFGREDIAENVINNLDLQVLTLQVSIPCPGHAFLIKQELNNLEGIEKIKYTPITTFVIYYNPKKISKEGILSLDIFKEYPAREVK